MTNEPNEPNESHTPRGPSLQGLIILAMAREVELKNELEAAEARVARVRRELREVRAEKLRLEREDEACAERGLAELRRLFAGGADKPSND